jgi:galactonate dehydratase
MDLSVEIHRNLTPDLAEAFAAGVKSVRPYFIEDPILPFSVASNSHVAGRMGGTIALAERNTNIWEFREFSDCHDIAILRPDVGLAGGFTQLKKIAAIAESRHQRIVPHNFTSPLATACHIQLAACTVNWDVQGYVRENREPWTRVVERINVVEGGFLAIPEIPGIGIELNLPYLRQAAYQPLGHKFAHGAARAMDGGVKHQ